MKKLIRELGSFRAFLLDRENRKTIVTITLAVLLLTGISAARDRLSGAKYITSGSEVKGVLRDDEKKPVSFPLRIEAEKDGGMRKRDVTLTIMPEDGKKEEKEEGYSEESLFEAEVQDLLSRLSASKGKRIMLPSKLADGTRLVWKKSGSGAQLFMILMAPVLIWLIYADGEKKKHDLRRYREMSVERELPAFTGHLLLLLGSGLIFRDAFSRIAEGYREKDRNTYFESEILAVEDETRSGVSDIVTVLTRRAEKMGSSRFSRLSGVIRDNQLKGVDVSAKLKTEGEILWDLRKKNAEECGRLAETKLTAPLAVLLMVLVLVTAAPAMIQVKGG